MIRRYWKRSKWPYFDFCFDLATVAGDRGVHSRDAVPDATPFDVSER